MDDTTVRVAGGDARLLDAARETPREAAAVVATGSTGAHGLEPLVLRTSNGRTEFYPEVTTERASAVVAGDVDPAFVVDHDPGATSLPVPATGPLGVGRRRLLSRCGWVDPADADAYDEFVASDPETVDRRVREVGLLGRGRGDVAADEPVPPAWEATRAADGDAAVVVNGNETDPRVRGDLTLLDGDPLAVLDAAVAVARLVDATDVVVTLPEDRPAVAARVSDAVAAREWELTPEVVVAPATYLAAEPTMALEALEGSDRLEARLRPPGPIEHGLYGRPTVVHTPRTLAAVREAVRRPETFDPDAADPGTRLVTAAGDVAAPATVELPTSGSLDALLDAVDSDSSFAFACVGGRFGGLTESLSVAPSAPALAAAGLGTDGGVEFHGTGTCPVALAGRRARLASEDNCGRCVPCREGSTQLTTLLRNVYGGDFDDDAIRELCRTVRASSVCDFGRDAVRPTLTAVAEFETDFRAHADGRCPAGACTAAGDGEGVRG
jgi:NADH-quinone oxidoreductase subunit F